MQTNKLYVGNLEYSTTYDELKELFSEYGEIASIKIIEGKGFGFIEFTNPDDAENAIQALNGSKFKGRVMKVDKARPPQKKNFNNKFNKPRHNYKRGE